MRGLTMGSSFSEAAPDLAAACRAALDFFEVCDDDDANRVAEQIRAALRKAGLASSAVR